MNPKEVNNILFVGTGGGNDVFSTILAALSLWQLGWRWKECALAGVLSPFHQHTVSMAVVPGVYIIQPDSERFVVRNDGTFKIGFVDSAVSTLIKEAPVFNSRLVFGFSLSEGSIGLSRALTEISQTYDYIVLVDVGGDCFYRGSGDTHVLSPMFDALVLRGFVDSGAPGLLFEAGPGTDGELEPEAIESALTYAQAESHSIHSEVMIQWESLYNQWIAPVREGRTVPMTIRAFNSQDEVVALTYRARAHLGTTRLYVSFEQRIKTTLCRQFFLVEPRRIENPFAVSCQNPLEWFLQTQVAQHRTNCEANLEYLYLGGLLYQFLTPSPLFPENDRLILIAQGLQDLCSGVCDRVWMFPEDWNRVVSGWADRAKVIEIEGLFTIERTRI